MRRADPKYTVLVFGKCVHLCNLLSGCRKFPSLPCMQREDPVYCEVCLSAPMLSTGREGLLCAWLLGHFPELLLSRYLSADSVPVRPPLGILDLGGLWGRAIVNRVCLRNEIKMTQMKADLQ